MGDEVTRMQNFEVWILWTYTLFSKSGRAIDSVITQVLEIEAPEHDWFYQGDNELEVLRIAREEARESLQENGVSEEVLKLFERGEVKSIYILTKPQEGAKEALSPS